MELAPGTRLAAVRRGADVFIPDANTMVQKGDSVILVGNELTFHDARKLFHDDKAGRRRVVLMGGTPMAVWLCRTLHDRNFSIRLFEINRQRAEELAEKLDWVTVINANPTERAVAEEEHLGLADVFIALRTADEDNLIASVLAKTMGVHQVIAVVQSPTYAELGYHVGVDKPVNPSTVAANEIIRTLEEGDFQRVSTLADGVVDAYQVRVTIKGAAVGKKLRDIKLSPDWIVAAVRRGDRAWVPGADDTIEVGDTTLLVGRHGTEKQLKKLFLQG